MLMPGLVDVHCHISELGRDWEGYYTATRAAAAGGLTTLMGMPLNSLPPTTSVEAFEMDLLVSFGAHDVKSNNQYARTQSNSPLSSVSSCLNLVMDY